jgi:hypothetical protein
METKTRVLVGILLVCNTLFSLFLIGLVVETRSDISVLEKHLASKKDLINLRQSSVENVLEKNCSRCHSEGRFAAFHGSEADMLRMIEEMQAVAGSAIDANDVEKIHASLELLQCNSCHEQERLRAMTLKSETERYELIRGMFQKSNVPVEDADVARIDHSYQQIYGF